MNLGRIKLQYNAIERVHGGFNSSIMLEYEPGTD